MHFMIFDDTGNAIDTFDSGTAARAALKHMVLEDPLAARELALFAYGDDGRTVGEAEVAADIVPQAAHRMVLSDGLFSWVQANAETFTARWRDVTGSQLRASNAAAAQHQAA